MGLGVLLLGIFVPTGIALSEVWGSVEYYAHGYLVAPVAAWMAWTRREDLAGLAPVHGTAGVALLALGLVAQAVGVLAGLLFLQGVGWIVALVGFVLWARGGAGVRMLWAPLAYLIFMVPIPPTWLTPLIVKLQSFVSIGAIGILRGVGVPVLREGNVIVVPDGALFVAEACSGITSIVTLLPVAALLAFLARPGPRAATGIVLSAIPVAMLWNLVRVLVTVAVAFDVGVERATQGELHESAGMLTFIAGCLTLLVLLSFVMRRSPPPEATA